MSTSSNDSLKRSNSKDWLIHHSGITTWVGFTILREQWLKFQSVPHTKISRGLWPFSILFLILNIPCPHSLHHITANKFTKQLHSSKYLFLCPLKESRPWKLLFWGKQSLWIHLYPWHLSYLCIKGICKMLLHQINIHFELDLNALF